MKRLISLILVVGLVSCTCIAGDSVKATLINGNPGVGVDLASPSLIQDIKGHFGRNWGKYLTALGTTIAAALVGANNEWFHKSDKGGNTSTTLAVHDESITINNGGDNNTVNVYIRSRNDYTE